MHDKLEILLNKIELNKDNYSCFNDGNLIKIWGNKEDDSFIFEISLNSVLPLPIYLEFIEKLKEAYITHNIVDAIFIVENSSVELLQEYYKHFITIYGQKEPLLLSFINNTISIENNVLTLEVANIAEKQKLKAASKKLKKDLSNIGFKLIDINIVINDQISNDIKEKIKKDLDIPLPEIKSVKKEEPSSKYPKREKKTDDPNVIMGRTIETAPTSITNIQGEEDNITVEVNIFGVDYFESPKSNFKIITLKITDYTDSIYCKIFIKDDDDYKELKGKLNPGTWIKIRGYSKNDVYSKELVLNARDINIIEKQTNIRKDTAEEKRIELHTHTMMSQMDGVVDASTIVKQAKKWGHRGIAITEHSGMQSFPDVHKTVKGLNKDLGEGEEPFKALYGLEITMVDDTLRIVMNPTDAPLLETTYVVFDFETTGFNAAGGDSIIEIGAVKIKNGVIIDKFNELIDPGRKLPPKIIEITNITDDMLKGKPNEEEAIKRFIKWYEGFPMVAHNAKFDTSFLEMCYSKYNLGEYKNTVIDTLELSRTLDSTYSRHNLSALVKRYDVPWDEDAHHRADYDAEGTAYVFHKMLQKLSNRNFETINDFNKLVDQKEIHKYGRTYHINMLAQNREGLKNMFKIFSYASTKYLYKTPRILRSVVEELREGLLIGSGCYESEVFVESRSKSDEELTNIINFYDYIEVQPPILYDFLVESGDFENSNEVLQNIKKVIKITKEAGKIIVATGDVHQLNPDDTIYREIIANQKVPGGGRHPLARKGNITIPAAYFRTTNEMLEEFSFLEDKELIKELVITNPNKIFDMIEKVDVIINTGGVPFSPKIENSVETVNDLVYTKAHSIYGDPLPELIKNRVEQELSGIIKGGYDVIYLISQKLVKKSNDDGYLVGSRGSVGSSFVAFLMGITEVNALPAHYVCQGCKYTTFEDENKEPFGKTYSSGYDLPDKECPKCNTKMNKEGQDMPFATFLGFNADKVPDIDLNFSGEYQAKAHDYTKELFGVDYVYRAGTFGTVADKTAYGFVKGYCEDRGITKRAAEIERLAQGCTGVKRTTGQHPGGIVVIPDYMEVFDFTPYQFPADDPNSLWRTTHFDYHPMEEEILKLDILGHDDPTMLRKLQDLSGIDVTTLPFDDKKVLSLLNKSDALNVTKEQIMCPTGTLGLPELGTKFVINMLEETKPSTFGELVKISGLSHGTDVWAGNASELIKNKVVPFKEVIGCRDDIMVYLMNQGLEPIKAFKIMEFVRKGMPTRNPAGWEEHATYMKEMGIADWYIESCRRIQYMFPKAHAVAYVMSALRIAWFKVYKPVYYYCAYLSIRCSDFDIATMIKGYEAIKTKIIELEAKGYEATNKEESVLEVLKVALEMTARGINFAPIDLNKSDAVHFVISEDGKSLIPPFRTIDGLGDTVANNIIEERKKGEFLSIEDLQKRGKVSGTIIETMKGMGILKGLPDSNQLELELFL